MKIITKTLTLNWTNISNQCTEKVWISMVIYRPCMKFANYYGSNILKLVCEIMQHFLLLNEKTTFLQYKYGCM